MTRSSGTLRVLHLAGSAVSDFLGDLFGLYAQDCLDAVADDRYEFHIAYVTPDGAWRFPTDLGAKAIAAAEPMAMPAGVAHLCELRVDVAGAADVLPPRHDDLPGAP